jgi:hypothetical protein
VRGNDETVNAKAPPTATEDMLADLGVSSVQAEQVRALLGEVAGLAHEVPEPSADVRALLGGATPLRRHPRAGGTSRSRGTIVAAAVGALAFGGVSTAAATNRLPDPVQEVVADATGGVVPHPVKPSNPPPDAPGHVDKPKATKTAKPLSTAAPGQIQKPKKPDPAAPEPAQPADPGSHGRGAHNEDNVTGGDEVKAEATDKVRTDHVKAAGSGSNKGKSR